MPPASGTASESGEPTRIYPDPQSTAPGRAVAHETCESEASPPPTFATHEHAPLGPKSAIIVSPSKLLRGLQHRGTGRERENSQYRGHAGGNFLHRQRR